MHDTITVGLPILAILFGILWNQRAVDKLEVRLDARIEKLEATVDAKIDKLEAKIDKLEDKMEARFLAVNTRLDSMQADLSQFYRDLGNHTARIEALEKRAA